METTAGAAGVGGYDDLFLSGLVGIGLGLVGRSGAIFVNALLLAGLLVLLEDETALAAGDFRDVLDPEMIEHHIERALRHADRGKLLNQIIPIRNGLGVL